MMLLLSLKESIGKSGWITPDGEISLYSDHWAGLVKLLPDSRKIIKENEDFMDDSDLWEHLYSIAYKRGYVAFLLENNTMHIRYKFDMLKPPQLKSVMQFVKQHNLKIRQDTPNDDNSEPQYTSHRYNENVTH